MKADQFVVQNNVKLKFKSEGIDYEMHLGIEDGLIILDSKLGKKIIFLGEQKEPTQDIKGLIETTEN